MKFLFLIFLFLTPPVLAEPNESTFLDGIAAYKTKDFEKAKEAFTTLAQQHPNHPALLYNLGLAEYQQGRFGMALGLWRKARTLDADMTPADQAISFTEEQLFPDKNNKTFIITILHTLLSLPLWFWWLLSLGSFAVAGWWSLEYGVKRRLTPNLWPSWLYFVFPFFIFTTIFATLDYLDHTQVSATIVQKDLETRVDPSETAPTLAPLEEGQVVSVEKHLAGWVQVRTQNGAPGWVPQNSVIEFKGR